MEVIEITCDILRLRFFYREAVNTNTLGMMKGGEKEREVTSDIVQDNNTANTIKAESSGKENVDLGTIMV